MLPSLLLLLLLLLPKEGATSESSGRSSLSWRVGPPSSTISSCCSRLGRAGASTGGPDRFPLPPKHACIFHLPLHFPSVAVTKHARTQHKVRTTHQACETSVLIALKVSVQMLRTVQLGNFNLCFFFLLLLLLRVSTLVGFKVESVLPREDRKTMFSQVLNHRSQKTW